MPKFQCEKCGALYAGWAGSKTCRECGGKLRSISWAEYYQKKKEIDDAEKSELTLHKLSNKIRREKDRIKGEKTS